MKLTDKQKDYLLRILKTFLQAAFGYVIARIMTVNLEDKKEVVALITGFFAAGLSALMNIGKINNADDNVDEEEAEDE